MSIAITEQEVVESIAGLFECPVEDVALLYRDREGGSPCLNIEIYGLVKVKVQDDIEKLAWVGRDVALTGEPAETFDERMRPFMG